MKEEEIKNAFNSINLSEESKKRLFNNINDNLNMKPITKPNNYKKLAVVAASFILVTGLIISPFRGGNQLENNGGIQSGTPIVDNTNINSENTSLNLSSLKGNIYFIEVSNNNMDTELFTITNDEELKLVEDTLIEATVKEMSEEDYLKVTDSQHSGNSIVMRMSLEDGSHAIVRVNLDLNLCNFNDKYHNVSHMLIQYLQERLN